ncbi:ATP-binding cassette domain-containing protein [Longimicrobium sp.]|uniref:ATP-binding cassette domain-containing protein n=1 Tax=Longimicrobium sp. TaxID=2029185 RepID=UPI002E36712D|nr:ATP-binding cassette domain-containing protein [Longimicrobium sp.]HEX6036460.1 ATP-binding cassette domain-containing protein [Longimicrobium sp.]
MERVFAADSIRKNLGGRTILKSASVWGTAGTITVVFGRNGCGKSTLLKVGAGLMGADQGVVHFRGRAYLRPRLHRLAAEGLFYLPDAGLLARYGSLADHLGAITRRFGGSLSAEDAEALDVAPLLEPPVRTLSGGELRRAEVAAAVARGPVCLLADEPLAGIDPGDQARIAAVLRRMAARGCAVIVTGHEVSELLDLADEVVWLTAGTTHGLGTAARAAANDQFRREYLGPMGRVR